MKSALRHFRTRRVIVALSILVVALGMHFYFSVLVVSDADDRSRVDRPTAMLPSADTTDLRTKKLREWLPIQTVDAPELAKREPNLLGVFVSRRSGAKAYIVLTSSDGRPPSYFLASTGDILEDWTVQRILPKSVELSKGDERRELLIFRAVDAGTAPSKPLP